MTRSALSLTILLLCILMLTLSGAGIFPLSLTLSTLILSATCVIVRIKPGISGQRQHIPYELMIAAVIVLYLSLTIAPLPRFMDHFIGTKRAQQNQLARSAVTDAPEYGLTDRVFTRTALTRNAAGTKRAILLALAAISAAILAGHLSPAHKMFYLRALTAFMALFAIAGFLHQWILPGAKTLLWYIPVKHGRPVACFMCRTHYAGFLAMGASMPMSLGISAVKKKKFISAVLYTVCFSIICFAVLLSLSRGAVIALIITILFIALLSLRRCSFRTTLVALTGLGLLSALIFFATFSLPGDTVTEPALERLGTLSNPLETTSASIRMSEWIDSLKIFHDYPLIGVGADGFQMIHPQYRTRSHRLSFTHAENEYLQMLIDCGIIGVILFGLLAVFTILRWRENLREHALSTEVSMAVLGASITVALHNAFDFPLYIPLYTILFASLLGLVTGPPRTIMRRPMVISVPPLLPPLAFLFVWCSVTTAVAIGRVSSLELDDPEILAEADLDTIAKSLISAPTYWYSWDLFGRAVFMKGTWEAMQYGERCMTQATEYDPYNYLLWESLGYTRLNMWDHQGAKTAFGKMKRLRAWKKIPPLKERRY